MGVDFAPLAGNGCAAPDLVIGMGSDGLTMEVMTSTGRIVETHLLYGSTSLDVGAYPSGVNHDIDQWVGRAFFQEVCGHKMICGHVVLALI